MAEHLVFNQSMEAEMAHRRSFKFLPACNTRGMIENNQSVFVENVDYSFEQTTMFSTEMLIGVVVNDQFRQMPSMLTTTGPAELVIAEVFKSR